MESKVYNINGLKIGGERGVNPTVLVGTIFYAGHKIVEDNKKGIFDKTKAEDLINKQSEMADTTGNPCMVDLVGDTPEAMVKYVKFLTDVSDSTFLLDGVDGAARIEGLKYIDEVGLQDRCVYSTISMTTKDDEINALKKSKVNSAILFAFSTYDPTPEGKLGLLEEIDGKKGLIELGDESGIVNSIVDTAVLDISSLSLSCKTIQMVKEKYGFPSGCAPANGMSLWKKAQLDKGYYKSCEASAAVFTASYGADFILYGPISSCTTVFPSVATYEALHAYASKWDSGKQAVEGHPLFKMF
tara:strand:+ start:649 stop:1548 length:900 start_codon:yes stop_codon:yes gene_type:complete